MFRLAGREGLLKLGDGRGRPFRVQDHSGYQDRAGQVAGMFHEQGTQAGAGLFQLAEMNMDHGLAQQERRILGLLGQPFFQRLDRGFILAVIQQTLSALDVGFHPLAAPFILLSATAGTRGIWIDQRHRGPRSRKVIFAIICVLDTLAEARASRLC
jgi:hypothetical protein